MDEMKDEVGDIKVPYHYHEGTNIPYHYYKEANRPYKYYPSVTLFSRECDDEPVAAMIITNPDTGEDVLLDTVPDIE